jgi:hypothetical protein
MNLEGIKSQVNLIEYARRFGISCDSKGMAKCPWHQDKTPSLKISIHDGRWTWRCFACDIGGSIVDLLMRGEKISEKIAIKKLLDEYGDKGSIRKGATLEIERTHIYRDQEGRDVLRKVKYKKNEKGLTWIFQHRGKGDSWQPGAGKQELLPYRLDTFQGQEEAIICEGEKDADRIAGLGLKMAVTSSPAGQGSWPASITKYFMDFKGVAFLYDVGAEKQTEKHATTLKEAHPALDIIILSVPLETREADISDYLDQAKDEAAALKVLLDSAVEFEPKPDYSRVMTIEELAIAQIDPIEWYAQPIIGKNLFTLIGGIKGIGKSLFVTQLALFLASGKTPFISDEITIGQPKKVLLIQQEVSLPAMKERLFKMRIGEFLDLGGRFLQKTTAGRWLKLTEEPDRKEVRWLIEKYEPDVLFLDPLYTFTALGLNRDQDAGPLLEALFSLKDDFGIGLVAVHHFSNKEDPQELRHMSGRFMGNSSLANAADVLISLDFLHPRYKNQLLPLPFNHYAGVEISTRHGEWPARFTIEREKDSILFGQSSIWQILNKILVPGQIEDILTDNDGEMLQQDLIEKFKDKASRSTVIRAIREAVRSNKIEKTTLLERPGKPVFLRLKEWPES